MAEYKYKVNPFTSLVGRRGATFECQAGKQLKRIDMRTLVGQDGLDATDGIDDASGTVIDTLVDNTISRTKLNM